MTQAQNPRRYQGINYKGTPVTIVTGDPPKTMIIIEPDGSQTVIPYEERRTGELTPVPQMPEGFTGWTDKDGNELS